MKKVKYDIGKPALFTSMYIGGSLTLAGLYFCYMGYFTTPLYYFPGVELLMKIIGPMILLITYIIVIPGMYNMEFRWQLDDQVLRYTEYGGLLDKILIFYSSKKHTPYNVVLQLNQIESIRLSWQDVPMPPYGIIGHPIIFNISMKDGSKMSINSLVTRDSKLYCEAIEYLQSKGIEIINPFDLLPVINNPNQSVAKYIDELEKKTDVKNKAKH